MGVFKCAGYGAVLAVVIGVVVVVRHKDIDDGHAMDPGLTWEEIGSKGLPVCKKPMILRNVFKYPDNSSCVGKDECIGLLTQAMIDKFGERTIEAFPPSHVSYKYRTVGHSDSVFLPLKDFLTDPKYKRYTIHTLMQLGNTQEYAELLSFGEGLNDFSVMTDMPNYHYTGSQFFMARGKQTGSQMHWAWGQNVFIMLAGSKRWLLVSPDALYQSNCTVGKLGLFGHCFPDNYVGTYGKVDIDMLMDVLQNKMGVPRAKLIDITLHPGDVLVNCDVWAHSIENQSPEVFAFSVRVTAGPRHRPWRPKAIPILLDSIWKSLLMKWEDRTRYTLLDGLFQEKGVLDKDERYKLSGIINQKKVGSKVGADVAPEDVITA